MKYNGKELYYTTLVSNYKRNFVRMGETLCTKVEKNVIYDEINRKLILSPNFEDNKLIKDGVIYAVGVHDFESLKCNGTDIYGYESLLEKAVEINLYPWANISIPKTEKDFSLTAKEEVSVKLKK